jgi:glycine cleavage system transcriptional repressor
MIQPLILIASGADRPGVLDEVSQYLFERGGNISDSKLLSLRGTFILLILIDAADEGVIGRIREGLPQLAAHSSISVDLRDAAPEHSQGINFRYRFYASGADQAGILNKLSHLFRVLNVNIDDVHTHVGVVQSIARPQFNLELLLSVPRDTPVVKLREYLGTICGELGIHWELTPA